MLFFDPIHACMGLGDKDTGAYKQSKDCEMVVRLDIA